ncbi:unnamed protein product [Bursaphelenchus xylophilus]|uniref:Phosphoinositide phospholipase C n=1 Tax=Bursaphelenchus xylophilus TaxID=6326 RepID=A0A1I7RX42_BURXY|nr:unnamed protein product [Bursaphelenchus xylophilus]CAG9121309.1 unnamed protein product [Bursaphelenchus xylophilus]
MSGVVEPLWIRPESAQKEHIEEEKMQRLECEAANKILGQGVEVRRIAGGVVSKPAVLCVHDGKILTYPSTSCFVLRSLRVKLSTPIKTMELNRLLEVRQGYHSDGLHRASKKPNFRKDAPEKRCFSLIAKHQRNSVKAIDFLADNQNELETWIDALKIVLKHLVENCVTFDEKIWLMKHFRKADIDKNGALAFNELWMLLKQLNSQMNEVHVRCLFNKILEKHNKSKAQLELNEFLELFRLLTTSEELKHALRENSEKSEEFMDSRDLCKFLRDVQGFEDVDWQTATDLIKQMEIHSKNPNRNSPVKMNGQLVLTANGFRRLLQSKYGSIYKPNHQHIYQDMTQPLCNYYIYSSHNTYLTGLQLSGRATVEGYISALKAGARLLELDIFDGEDGEPKITHKRTLITAIGLRNALTYIKRYAFEKSPYPIILTLENHVSYDQQKTMAQIFEEILADMLYIPTPETVDGPIPSPEQLKFKILLRGKVTQGIFEADDEDSNEDEKKKLEAKSSGVKETHPAMNRIIALPTVPLKKHFVENIIHDHASHSSASLGESVVDWFATQSSLIHKYTQKHMVKSYPHGIRQDSSNMHPLNSWLCGVQCVAMNLQTEGEETDLNVGLFTVNGMCGYYLKPEILRLGLNPIEVGRTTEKWMRMRIKVISGQYLPNADPSDDIIDPYVCLQVIGIPADTNKCRTKALRDNGFNPVWNEEFSFQITSPDVAFLRFVVMDFDTTSADDFVGEFTIPVTSIRPGYSFVRLRTFQRSPDEAASLFVHIDISDEY